MAELKTKQNDASVDGYINSLEDEKVKADCQTIIAVMQKATGEPAKMWGDKMIGFGKYQYKSAATGKGGDWFVMGFGPRKATLALYLMCGLEPLSPYLEKLGKHKLSGSCLHIKRMSDVDADVFKKMIEAAAKEPMKYTG